MTYKQTMTAEEFRSLGAVCDAKPVADFTGEHVRTIQRLAAQGTLPAFKCGHSWKFSTAKILALFGIEDAA